MRRELESEVGFDFVHVLSEFEVDVEFFYFFQVFRFHLYVFIVFHFIFLFLLVFLSYIGNLIPFIYTSNTTPTKCRNGFAKCIKNELNYKFLIDF